MYKHVRVCVHAYTLRYQLHEPKGQVQQPAIRQNNVYSFKIVVRFFVCSVEVRADLKVWLKYTCNNEMIIVKACFLEKTKIPKVCFTSRQ